MCLFTQCLVYSYLANGLVKNTNSTKCKKSHSCDFYLQNDMEISLDFKLLISTLFLNYFFFSNRAVSLFKTFDIFCKDLEDQLPLIHREIILSIFQENKPFLSFLLNILTQNQLILPNIHIIVNLSEQSNTLFTSVLIKIFLYWKLAILPFFNFFKKKFYFTSCNIYKLTLFFSNINRQFFLFYLLYMINSDKMFF